MAGRGAGVLVETETLFPLRRSRIGNPQDPAAGGSVASEWAPHTQGVG